MSTGGVTGGHGVNKCMKLTKCKHIRYETSTGRGGGGSTNKNTYNMEPT